MTAIPAGRTAERTPATRSSLPPVAQWPGRHRRRPRPWNSKYLHLKPLSEQIRAEIDRVTARHAGALTVLDLGCGYQTYRPFFGSHPVRYVGLDVTGGPFVDVVGVGESIPLASSSVELVLCTQVLEHTDDPQGVLNEIARILRPGGTCLLSTHGVYPYHAHRDYWRWTGAGLALLFQRCAAFADVRVLPNGGFFSCLLVQLAVFLQLWRDHLSLPGWAIAAIGGVTNLTINAMGTLLDRVAPEPPGQAPGWLVSNYLVVAVRGDGAVPAGRGRG